MKIALNWLVKNRNKVRVFYLKEYNTKEELYSIMSKNNFSSDYSNESVFDIKNFIREEISETISVDWHTLRGVDFYVILNLFQNLRLLSFLDAEINSAWQMSIVSD